MGGKYNVESWFSAEWLQMSKYHTPISENVKYLPANIHFNKCVAEDWLVEENEVTQKAN